MPEPAEQIELWREDRQPVHYSKVKRANQLVIARYSLGELEQKLLLYAVSMIKPEAKQFSCYRIEITSYAAACGLSSHSLDQRLWDSAKIIAGKSLIILNHREPDGRLVDLVTHWFAEVKRAPGYIDVTFPPSLSSYLLGVKNRFFRCELGILLRFKGESCIRLYEWLKSWKFRGSKEISIAELRVVLGLFDWDDKGNVVKERLTAFADVKKWALKPSLKQINAASDIFVEMLEQKEPGTKRVKSILFSILANPSYVSDPTTPKFSGVRVATPIDAASVDLVARLQSEFGFTAEQARKAVATHSIEYIQAKADIVLSRPRSNAAGSLLKALEDDWQPAKKTHPPSRARKVALAPAPAKPITEPSAQKAAPEEVSRSGNGSPAMLAWRIEQLGEELGTKKHAEAMERIRLKDDSRTKEG